MAKKNSYKIRTETQKGNQKFKEQTEKQTLPVESGKLDVHQQLKQAASKIDEILNQKVKTQKVEMGKKAEVGKKPVAQPPRITGGEKTTKQQESKVKGTKVNVS